MADTTEVGLQFDLTGWTAGINAAREAIAKGLGSASGVMKPFDQAMTRTLGVLKRTLGSFAGQIVALSGLNASFQGLKEVIVGSLRAYQDYADSVTVVTAALDTLKLANSQAGVAMESFRTLAKDLSVTMATSMAATNTALATFLTRGFDTSQAEQLAVIAASFAAKTGKPLEAVSKIVADAANGSAEAMKELGVQVAVTGNRVDDAKAAVAALKETYGGIGAEVTNPQQRLAAAWERLRIELGEKLAPVIEPLINRITDFLTGTEGSQFFQGFADGIGKATSMIKPLIQIGATLFEIFRPAFELMANGLSKIVSGGEDSSSVFGALGNVIRSVGDLLGGAIRLITGFFGAILGDGQASSDVLGTISKILATMINSLAWMIDQITFALNLISRGGALITNLLSFIYAKVGEYIYGILGMIPGVSWGFDIEAMEAQMREAATQAAGGMLEAWQGAGEDFASKSANRVMEGIGEIETNAQRQRWQSRERIDNFLDDTAGDTFAGRVAYEQEEAKARKSGQTEEAEAQKMQERLESNNQRLQRMTARRPGRMPEKMTLQIMSVSPDRFSKGGGVVHG